MKQILKGLWITFLIFLSIISLTIYILGFDMNRLPEGDFLDSYISPDGKYTLNLYENYGTLTSVGHRGELIYNKSNKKSKNIYWDYKVKEISVFWIDNKTISINGHILNVKKDIYDWRR